MSARLQTTAPAKRNLGAPEGFRRLSMNLPVNMHRALRLAAIEDECTITDLVEALITRHLDALAEIQSLKALRASISPRVTS